MLSSCTTVIPTEEPKRKQRSGIRCIGASQVADALKHVADMQDLRINISLSNILGDKTLEIKFTHFRPYISDNGAMTSGNRPRERKEMESIIARIIESVISSNMFRISLTHPE
jgi:vacuolar-type H+-ATPase subunit D/Vma8